MEHKHEDLAGMDDAQARHLCEKLRGRLIETVSQTGGHLASGLGVVELTVALHRVFDTGRDRLLFDVGHQSYAHKLLTGRWDDFETLRQFGGISGFPHPMESDHDAFVAGHASTSVSAALGMARARTLRGEEYHVIALIGDGALTGGLAFEGLSDAGESGERLIVILNDNGMSITQNVGGVARHLAELRLRPTYHRFKGLYHRVIFALPWGKRLYRVLHRIKTAVKQTMLPCSMFEDMGFTYYGPIDGHDLGRLTESLRHAKTKTGPTLIHVRTRKGCGYPPAEACPAQFHGVAPFDMASGAPLMPRGPDFSTVFGETMCKLAGENGSLCAITAAMQDGTGLSDFAARYPSRLFDVGIAEGHAVTMASGMAKQGIVPVFAVYSSFLQRGFDMLLHDMAILKLHVVLAVDRAGIVGNDGVTHQGCFDIAYLGAVPGLSLYAPASFAELREMLAHAVAEESGPVALRYPRGGEGAHYSGGWNREGHAVLRRGEALTMVSYGVLINHVLAAAETLSQEGIEAEVIKLNRLTPADFSPVLSSVGRTGRLLVLEDCVDSGSIGRRLAAELALENHAGCKIRLINVGDRFVTHGDTQVLQREYGIDADSVCRAGRELCDDGKKEAGYSSARTGLGG